MRKFVYIIVLMLCFINCANAHEEENLQLQATITKSSIQGDVLVYNLSNGKGHSPDCEWAQKCTKNCIYIDKEEAKKIFYIPCAVCGGGVIHTALEHGE